MAARSVSRVPVGRQRFTRWTLFSGGRLPSFRRTIATSTETRYSFHNRKPPRGAGSAAPIVQPGPDGCVMFGIRRAILLIATATHAYGTGDQAQTDAATSTDTVNRHLRRMLILPAVLIGSVGSVGAEIVDEERERVIVGRTGQHRPTDEIAWQTHLCHPRRTPSATNIDRPRHRRSGR